MEWMSLAPGMQLGHFKILSPLGKGGMGEVYRAEDVRLNREVALKVLPESLTLDSHALSRFEREAKALAALEHPNILTLFDVGTDQGISFTVTEILRGETLKSKIQTTKFTWEKALELAIPVVDGLAAAHSKGVIHRDLKPENIFVTSDARIKILDFGLARWTSKISPDDELSQATTFSRTEPGTVVGTIPYMSPEQASGNPLDPRSDIFSFGCVLYEMLTGKRPFGGNNATETIASILKEDPPPPGAFGREIPPELERTVFHCLEKDPDRRFQSARDLAYDLRSILSHSKEQEKTRSAVKGTPLRQKYIYPFVVAAILIVSLLSAWLLKGRYFHSKARDKSVAVLPFKNLNHDKTDEYFSDGITEDVITQLSKIHDLKVISRTSMMHYKNSDKTLRQIGDELHVANVLEGSVRKEGTRLRIVAQLIDAQRDEHLWVDTYDRELKDVFEIQSDVAKHIADALRSELTTSEKERIEQKPTVSITAYDYYLKGRQYYLRFHREDNEAAIALFKKALEIDPGYALAYAGLCDAYQRRLGFGLPESNTDLALEAGQKAISLNPNLAEAYNAVQKCYSYKGWTGKAREALEKAVQLNPNSVAVGNLAVMYLDKGMAEKAFPLFKRYLILEPASSFPYLMVGEAYLTLGALEPAEHWLKKSLDLQPDFTYAYGSLSELYLEKSKFQEARNYAMKALSVDSGGTVNVVAGNVELFAGNYDKAREYYEKSFSIAESLFSPHTHLGFILLKQGKREEAQKLFRRRIEMEERVLQQGKDTFYPRLELAKIYSAQGNRMEALKWLQQAIDAGYLSFSLLELDPVFENLHGDPQFQKMISDLKARVTELLKRVQNLDQRV